VEFSQGFDVAPARSMEAGLGGCLLSSKKLRIQAARDNYA
jgi:hypothetical protein